MPYKDKEQQRQYQLTWIKARREKWFQENGPCVNCGSCNDLEVDHINPTSKVSHRVWTWTKSKRELELAKCQVLCYDCHLIKSINEKSLPLIHGTHTAYLHKFCRCNLCKESHKLYMREYRAHSSVN